MNKTREFECVPKKGDGYSKYNKPSGETIDKVAPSPPLGIAKKVIPKKHPPRTSSAGAAVAVDRKPTKNLSLGRSKEKKSLTRQPGQGRLERSSSEESSSDASTNKATPKKHAPRKSSMDGRIKGSADESEGNSPAIRPNKPLRKHPPSREASMESTNGNKNAGSAVKPPKKHSLSREPSKDSISTAAEAERKAVKHVPTRRSISKTPVRQNSFEKFARARSIERKSSTPSPSFERSRARARSIERKASSKSPSKEVRQARSKERKPSNEPASTMATKPKLRARSIEHKLERQNSRDKIRPRSASKERTRPGSAERVKSKTLATVLSDRPTSEELISYKPAIRELTLKRSKSEDRVRRRGSMGNGGSTSSSPPVKPKPKETPSLSPILKGTRRSQENQEKKGQKKKSKPGSEIIELNSNNKESTCSYEETETTADESASCCSSKPESTTSCEAVKDQAGSEKALQTKVSFGKVDIQEFSYSMGVDVVSRDGPPVAIAYYQPLRANSFELDTFEQVRSVTRRHREDLLLSEIDRITILQRHGYTAEDIEQACWEAEKVRKQRYKSIKNKEWDGWNAASESLARKISKISNAKDLLFGG